MSFTNTYNIPVPTFEFGNSAEIFTDICAALDDLNIQNQINQKQNILEAGITYVQCGNIQATSILDDGKLTCNGGLLIPAGQSITIPDNSLPESSITNLISDLAGKQPTITSSTDISMHDLTCNNITCLAGTIQYSEITLNDGTLTIAKTNGLQTALDSKQNVLTSGSVPLGERETAAPI